MNGGISLASRPLSAGRTRSLFGVTIAAVLVLVVVAAAALLVISRELHAARTSYAEVLRTREALEQIRIFLSTLQDAETGARGYVLTSNEEYLEPYSTAQSSFEAELSHLQALSDDAEAQQIAEQLAGVAHAQLAFLGDVVAMRRSQDARAVLDLIRRGTGKRLMDRVRELVAALEAHEKDILAARLTAFEQRSDRTDRAIRLTLFAAILVMLAAGAVLLRHTQRRVRAERTARETLSLLRSTMENVSQGIAVFDNRQRLIAWNARYIELRGLHPAQIREGMSWGQILQQGAKVAVFDSSGVRDATKVPAIMADGRSFEVEGSRADGAMLQIRGQQMPDGNYIVTYTDVTALKISESAYREQATRLSSILDSAVDAIVTINESGSIESWSGSAERLFGYAAPEVLRRNVRMLLPDPHSSTDEGYLGRFIHSGEGRISGQRREVEALHKDGRRIPVDLGISEMCIGSRRLFIAIIRDLSSRQEIEQLKSGFVSTVSHELRTPLTSIAGSLGLLAGGTAGPLPGKATRLIDIARLNCDRLVRLINDILDLEKAESGRLELRLESQSLHAIVQQAIEANRAYAQSFGVTIELSADRGDVSVLVDRDRLIQVLTNILSNAAKFSPRGAVVLVLIQAEADSVRVSVCDRGPGIAPDFQRRIFQRFAQADSSDSRAKGGTGLGLSIAKSIMERLGGSIGFDSAPGEGSTFYIRLPVRHEIPAPVRVSEGVLNGPAVLVCEDDPDVARALVEMLGSAGMRVATVPTVREAKAALDRERYDVALVDLHLADADGLELVTDLRTHDATRSLPVIVMTARARTSADAGRVGTLQLADWLQKPIDPRRLLDAIHNVLLELRGRRAQILHVEDDESLTQLVNELLAEEADVTSAHSLAQARLQVESSPYDLVILDIALGDGSGLDLLPLLQRGGRPAPPVILYSASEPSRELSNMVQAALVKSRDSVEHLLGTVRRLASPVAAPEGSRS